MADLTIATPGYLVPSAPASHPLFAGGRDITLPAGGEYLTPGFVESHTPQLLLDALAFCSLKPRPRYPLVIDNPLIAVTNPIAGGGKGMFYAAQFIVETARMSNKGKLSIVADPKLLTLPSDPADRKKKIIDAIKEHTSSNPPLFIVFAGDGTFGEVASGSLEAKRDRYPSIVVAAPGGNANDMMIELDVPRRFRWIIQFLTTAQKIDLDVITARFNGDSPMLLIHSQGNGVSGVVFSKVARQRTSSGHISIQAYLHGLVDGIWNAKTFYVRINGGEPLATGEVLTLANSTGLGRVTRTPIPRRGGRLHILPVNPGLPGPLRLMPGLPPIADVFVKSALYSLGKRSVIDPDSNIHFLSAERMFDIGPRTKLHLEFFDERDRPTSVTSVLNGDPMEGIHSVDIEGTDETIQTLASANAPIMLRRGMGVFAESELAAMNTGTPPGITTAAPMAMIGGLYALSGTLNPLLATVF